MDKKIGVNYEIHPYLKYVDYLGRRHPVVRSSGHSDPSMDGFYYVDFKDENVPLFDENGRLNIRNIALVGMNGWGPEDMEFDDRKYKEHLASLGFPVNPQYQHLKKLWETVKGRKLENGAMVHCLGSGEEQLFVEDEILIYNDSGEYAYAFVNGNGECVLPLGTEGDEWEFLKFTRDELPQVEVAMKMFALNHQRKTSSR